MVIPNMVMKFNNFEFFYKFVKCLTCRLHSPPAWKALMELFLRSYEYERSNSTQHNFPKFELLYLDVFLFLIDRAWLLRTGTSTSKPRFSFPCLSDPAYLQSIIYLQHVNTSRCLWGCLSKCFRRSP